MKKRNATMVQNTPAQRRGQAGLSLIEMSLCLIIMGVLISGGLQAYKGYKSDLDLTNETRLRDRITSALAFYVEKNNRFPCPASATLTPDSASFGREPFGCTGGTASATSVIQGMLPVYALNLPYHLAADLYGRKMTYAVTESLTKTNGMSNNAAVRVTNNNGQFYNAPFIVVYHGQDGKGAISLLASGTAFACSGSAADVENCNGDRNFNDFQYARMTDSNSANHFDDRVVYSLATKETSVWAVAPTGTGLAIGNKNNANVGIGVTQPEAKLHVNGDLQVDSTSDNVNINASGKVSAHEIRTDQKIEAGTDMQGTRIRATVFTYD